MLQYATKQGPGSLCWCIWLLNKQNKKTSIICPLWRKYRNHSLNGNMETHTWSLDMQSFFLRLTKIQRIRNRSGLQIQLVSRSPEGSASTHYSTTHSVHFTKSLDPLCKIITSIVDACMKKRKVKSTTYVLDPTTHAWVSMFLLRYWFPRDTFSSIGCLWKKTTTSLT